MLNLLLRDPVSFVVVALSLVVAISIHEFAHAFAADKLGDPTPRIQGRLTLNPLAHLDPLGTLLLIIVGFGWGKPVMFDPYNLEDPKRDAAIISLAGPLSNISLALILAIIIRLLSSPFSPFLFLANLIAPLILLNVVLAVFNLIPIHPLDGGKILVGILPRKDAAEVDAFLRKYGMLILILMIFPIFGGVSPVSAFISPIIDFILGILLPSPSLI